MPKRPFAEMTAIVRRPGVSLYRFSLGAFAMLYISCLYIAAPRNRYANPFI
jgi:hypothetical protein